MSTGRTGLTIAETAERTGLSAHTLRYYERDGLMLAVDRSASGHRRYTEARPGVDPADHPAARSRACRSATYGATPSWSAAGRATRPARLDLLRAHRAHVQAELDAVQQHLRAIDDKIALYERLEAS